MDNKAIQVALNSAGYGPLITDGVLGAKSLEAIKRFQAANHLMADGVPGAKTQARLQEVLTATAPASHETPPASTPVASGMVVSAKGAADIALSEGIKLKTYLDSIKIPTIGIGFTWRSAAFRKWWSENRSGPFDMSSTMTKEECYVVLTLLAEEEYGAAVNNFLGKEVPQHVFDGMVSVVFNCGAGALKWKWAAACKAGDYSTAARLLRSTAVTADGKKLKGLVTRRAREATLIEKGIYAA